MRNVTDCTSIKMPDNFDCGYVPPKSTKYSYGMDGNFYVDGVLHGRILEKKGMDFKIEIISKNKYLNGTIQEIKIIPNAKDPK